MTEQDNTTTPTREQEVIAKARKHVADSSRWGSDGSVVFLQEDDTYWRLGDVLRAYDQVVAERDAALALAKSECDSNDTLRARLAACERELAEEKERAERSDEMWEVVNNISLCHQCQSDLENELSVAGREYDERKEADRSAVAAETQGET